MNIQVFPHKSLLAALLGAPMLLGGCTSTDFESFQTEKDRMDRIHAAQDQTLAELRATNEKLDALNGKLDNAYHRSLRK